MTTAVNHLPKPSVEAIEITLFGRAPRWQAN